MYKITHVFSVTQHFSNNISDISAHSVEGLAVIVDVAIVLKVVKVLVNLFP